MVIRQQLTFALASFVSEIEFEDFPVDAVTVASTGFTDVAGVMMAGSREPVVTILERTFSSQSPVGSAALYFSSKSACPADAALINGTAGHALDFDDAGGHRSTILVPAILAAASGGKFSGQDMITAYVAGYEVWSELARREHGQLHERGWHPTGIYGAVAAACAVARLKRLSIEQTVNAIGIAASCASGLVANFGSMVKPFHAGHAARTGIVAVELARNGMEASPHVLEHERGLLAAVSQNGEYDVATSPDSLGSVWRICEEGVSIKKFPSCYCTHRAIDSMLELTGSHAFSPQEVESILVRIGRTQKAILHADNPKTGLEGKFSIQFVVACALSCKRVSLFEVTDDGVAQPEIQQLMQLVEVELSDEYDSLMKQYAPWDQVIVRLKDGTVLEGKRIARARGHIQNPLSVDELRDKFLMCCEYSGLRVDGVKLFETLINLRAQKPGWIDELKVHE